MYTDDPDTGRGDRGSNIAKKLLTGNRPKSKMTICEPITLDPIDPSVIELMKIRTGIEPEDRKRVIEAFKRMREDGKKVMYALAQALPPEKRGIWDKKPASE